MKKRKRLAKEDKELKRLEAMVERRRKYLKKLKRDLSLTGRLKTWWKKRFWFFKKNKNSRRKKK